MTFEIIVWISIKIKLSREIYLKMVEIGIHITHLSFIIGVISDRWLLSQDALPFSMFRGMTYDFE